MMEISKSNNEILLFSGEGNEDAFRIYKGKRTIRALKARLIKEKHHGDRWSKAYIYLHDNEFGKVYVNLDDDSGYKKHLITNEYKLKGGI